jgi:hypothetical protein
MKKFTQWVDTVRQAELNEASELQKSYQDYFQKKLEKFGAKSPAELSEDDKKKFFNEISNEWEKGKGLKDGVKEGVNFGDEVNEYKSPVRNEVKKLLSKTDDDLYGIINWNKDDATGYVSAPDDVDAILATVKVKYPKARVEKDKDGNNLLIFESSVNEAEIKNAEEFKKFATDKLKKVHGDDFDEAKADKVIKGLSDEAEKSGDWGAAVGKLNKA